MLPRPRHGARRNTRLSYVLHQERRAGVEPALPPWQGGRLPPTNLIGARTAFGVPNCQTTRAPGGTRTLVAALRVRYPRHWTTSAITSVGPEGLEPSPGGLRVRCAATSTLIPFSASLRAEWARRESNPQSDPYKRPALTVELRAVSGAERTRTFTYRIKSPVCCRYTTTPKCRPGVCVSIVLASWSCSWVSVVALRVELSTTRLSAVSGQPALDYRMPTSLSVKSGWQESNLLARAPKARGPPLPHIPSFPVRTGGLEPPISWPPARRDTQASLRSVSSSPYGNRTRLSALKGRYPQTDRRTSRLSAPPSTQTNTWLAHTFHAVDWEVLESSSAAFQAAARPSQLPVQQKKPDVVMTPGFRYSSGITARCHMRNG